MKRQRTEEDAGRVQECTKKIVLNKCMGGFGLSEIATHALMERLGYTTYDARESRKVLDEIPRDHPILVQVVEEFGRQAWFPSSLGDGAEDYLHCPVVVEIPNVSFEIVWHHGFEVAIPTRFERVLGPS